MTPDDLRAWIEYNFLFHQQAADLLAISVNQLRKMLYGARPVDKRTVRMIELMNMPIRVVDKLVTNDRGHHIRRRPRISAT